MADSQGFVGVFDSGVGGISILKCLIDELPHEDFRFFGDSANAPYGDRSADEVLALSRAITDAMVSEGAKAVVIACNTATAAAAEPLRRAYPDVPIIGVEPALKPAVLANLQGRVLVMATALTLSLEKFHRLSKRWGSAAEVIPVPCVGLVDRIEHGDLDANDLHALLESLVGEYRGSVDGVVLGCTHYPFVKQQIREVLGDVAFYDSGEGTARRLRSQLEEHGLLATRDRAGTVSFASSRDTQEELALYERFFAMQI